MSNNFILTTAGGHITCLQCNAKSKRTKQQCRAPATRGKTKCRFHGGLSTGPKTVRGKLRCAEVKTIHGFETRQIRKERSEGLARLYELEILGRKIGLITGEKTRGPKPKGLEGST